MFKKGEKVVCVSTSKNGIVNVIKGNTYTVEGYSPDNGIGVIVKEAISSHITNGFYEHRFKKVEYQWIDEILDRIIEEVESEELVLV